MASLDELIAKADARLNEMNAAPSPAAIEQKLDTRILREDQRIERSRRPRIQNLQTVEEAEAAGPPAPKELTSNEILDAESIRGHLDRLSQDTGQTYDFDDASVSDAAAPAMTKFFMDMARSEKDTTIEKKFNEYFPGGELLIVPGEAGKTSKMVYRMSEDEPFKLLPKTTPAALLSHLAREDVALSLGGGAAGGALGTLAGGPIGGVAGGVAGAMAGDAAGQMFRKTIEDWRGFGEGFQIDIGQMLIAGAGQGAVEAWRVGRPAYKQYVAEKLLKRLDAEGFEAGATKFAIENGITSPGIGQISKSPLVRTLFNQATSISKEGEQFVLGQSREAFERLKVMAGEGDESAKAAYEALGGGEFQALADRAKAAAYNTTGMPNVSREAGGEAVREGLQKGSEALRRSYDEKLTKAARLMRGERAPYFDMTDVKKVTQATTEGKAFKTEEGLEIPFAEPSEALAKLQNDILSIKGQTRTQTNSMGGTATAVEQMRNLRQRAFSIMQEGGSDAEAAREIYKSLSKTMERPVGIDEIRVRPVKTPKSKAAQSNVPEEGDLTRFGQRYDEAMPQVPQTPVKITQRDDVGYKMYYEGIKELKRYEEFMIRNKTKNAAGQKSEEGNLAWSSFQPGSAQTWREWKEIMPPEQFQKARDSVASELVRMEKPGSAIAKLDSFANSETLDLILSKDMQRAIRDIDTKKLAWERSGLKQAAENQLTPYENVAEMTFSKKNPAKIKEFMDAATDQQKEGLRIGIFKHILGDVKAAAGPARGFIDQGRLKDVVDSITADPQFYGRILKPDDVNFLTGLQDYVATTARSSDMGAVLKRAELASKLGSGFQWLFNPGGNLRQLLSVYNEDMLATILSKPNMRAGLAAVGKGKGGDLLGTLEAEAGQIVPRDVRLIGAFGGEALNALMKLGETSP